MSSVLERSIYGESVSISIHGNIMLKTVANVFNAKRAATFGILLLVTKNQQLCCLAVMALFTLSKRRVLVTKMKKTISFLKFLRRSDSITPEVVSKRHKNHFICGVMVSTPHRFIQLTESSFPFSFCTLSVYLKAPWFLQSPRTVLSGLSTFNQTQLT